GHIKERASYDGSRNGLPTAPSGLRTGFDEAAARRSLRGQIAKLERELAAVFANAYPRRGLEWRGGSRRGPRRVGLGEAGEVRGQGPLRLSMPTGARSGGDPEADGS